MGKRLHLGLDRYPFGSLELICSTAVHEIAGIYFGMSKPEYWNLKIGARLTGTGTGFRAKRRVCVPALMWAQKFQPRASVYIARPRRILRLYSYSQGESQMCWGSERITTDNPEDGASR